MIIGGKLDRDESPVALVSFEEKGEQYLLMEFREKIDNATVKHRFYMAAGMAPAEATKIYRYRIATPRQLWVK